MDLKIYASLIDEVTEKQIYELANHKVYKNMPIRVMPDCHAGKGCTVGTTIDLGKHNYVTPNLVGVDIGCLDKDTELLTKDGWIKISEYGEIVNKPEILIFDKDTEMAKFEKPLAFIKDKCEEFYKIEHKYGLNQRLSAEHKILFYKGSKGRGYKKEVITAKEFVEKHNKLSKGIQGGFKTVFDYDCEGLNISDDEIRLMIACAADGYISKILNEQVYFKFHLKKVRKVKRLKQLLSNLNIQYKEYYYENKDQTYHIYFKTPEYINKKLNYFYDANKRQLEIIMEECILWDGCKKWDNKNIFFSTTKEYADLIQFAYAANGIRASMHVQPQGKPEDNYKDCYVVYETNNNIVGNQAQKIETVKSEDGFKYCVTTSTGFFVARRNNYIFVTGNCGMLTVKLKNNLVDLERFDKVVHEVIPSGFEVREKPHDFVEKYNVKELLGDLHCKDEVNIERAILSIGTLGGGEN